MSKKRWVIFLALFALLINSSLFFVYAKAANDTPRLEGGVNSANLEITMPTNGAPAKGSIGLSVIPKGSTTQAGRQPVDLVFVIDRSGSMGDESVGGSKIKDENGKWTTRMELAKKSIQQAVDMLKEDNPSGNFDRIGLISFSSTATIDVALTDNKNNAFETQIMKKVNGLKASGGTNYSDALEKANQMLASSKNSKYIIFLTDGEPTQFAKSKVKLKGKYYYRSGNKKIDAPQDDLYNVSMTIYTNGSVSETVENTRTYYPYDASLRGVTERIQAYALDAAGELASSNTKLYSIGFELADAQLDFLQNLSQMTGASAVRGTTQNLKDVFESITKQIRELKMSEVKIKVKLNNIQGNSSGQNIELTPDATAVRDGDYAVINLNDVSYKRDGSTPSPQSYSLPLIFKTIGTYELNDIKLYYKDFDGKDQVVSLPSVTITVKNGTMAVTGVKLNKDKLTMNPGNEEQLTATVLPENATNKAVTWSTADPNIAKVDAQGKITAQNPGITKITVTTIDGGFTAKCNVTVLSPAIPVTNISLPAFLTLDMNTEKTLVPEIKPLNATNRSVKWESSAPTIASVDDKGIVKGIYGGTAIITATALDNSGLKAECKVTVKMNPEFHGTYQVVGDEGKLVVNHDGPSANTITDKTEWYRWDRNTQQWIKFRTGKFDDNMATISVSLDKENDKPQPTTFGLKAVTPGFPGREVVGEKTEFPITFTPESIDVSKYFKVDLNNTGDSSDNKAVKLELHYKIKEHPDSYILDVKSVSYVLKPVGSIKGAVPVGKEEGKAYRWVKPTNGKTTTYEADFTIKVDFLHPVSKKKVFSDSITLTSPALTIKGTGTLQ
ncbi:Ig-like domain-containing protein [Aneurinibacillus aneurinilyticus]|uniref:Ig-like domain-containing protein n=1 Tax=Aneurinibacillus aneurinilyticus TaxID=1391 RepID=UPI00366BECF2